MQDPSTRLQVANIVLMGAVGVGLLLNTCAVDRLERQVIRVATTVEKLDSSGGYGGAVAPSAAVGRSGSPGSGTGVQARGWGDTTAEVLFVTGAQPGAPLTLAQKPKPQGDTYISRRSGAPGTLNYFATSEGATTTVSKFSLESLIEVDPDKPPGVIAALATEWEVSDDKLTYTFHLRKGVRFADGRPFTSADVAFSFDVIRDPAVNADHLRSNFEDVVSVETPDDHTVVVRYRKPYWRGVYSVGSTLRVLNKGWVQEQIPGIAAAFDLADASIEPGQPGFGEAFNSIRVVPPGTGPYYFAEDRYDPKKPVELLQNPFWWGIQVRPEWHNFSAMRWIYVSDDLTAFESFRKEEFDVSVVDFQPWDDEYSTDPTITDISTYYEYDHMALGFAYIAWNQRSPPFDDARVRRAMTHLVNRQWIVDEIERGRGTVAVCPSKRSYPDYNNDLEPLEFNIEKARALLAEAGWVDSDGDGVLDKDGQRFEFEMKLGSPRRFYTQVNAQFADAAAQVGVRMTTRTLEWSTFIDDFYERRFDAVTLYGSFADPWVEPFEEFHSSADVPRGGNATGWHNPEVDALLEKARGEFDDDVRNGMYRDFCTLFQQDQPMTLLNHGMVGVLQHKRFSNVSVRPTGLRVHDAWVEPENVLHE